jgi:hypothetical protein
MARARQPSSPGEIRSEVLELHAELRERVREVLSAARSSPSWPPTRELSLALAHLEAGVRHMVQREQKRLRPVLAKVDAWGEFRAERLRTLHRAYRDAIAHVESGDHDARSAARSSIMRLVRALRREERELLGRDLLRDDTVAVDQSGG